MATSATTTTVVEIPCPRCNGKGSRPTWHPDAGICYRCKGDRVVRVDIPRYEAALRHLRVRFVLLRASARAGHPGAAEALRYCLDDGLRLRATLDTARAVLERG